MHAHVEDLHACMHASAQEYVFGVNRVRVCALKLVVSAIHVHVCTPRPICLEVYDMEVREIHLDQS